MFSPVKGKRASEEERRFSLVYCSLSVGQGVIVCSCSDWKLLKRLCGLAALRLSSCGGKVSLSLCGACFPPRLSLRCVSGPNDLTDE